MKRAVMTALAVTLLSGTSALAQDDRGGPLARVMREAANAQAQNQRSAPPQRERQAQQQQQQQPQQQPQQRQQRQQPQPQQRQQPSQSQSRGNRGGDDARRDRDRGSQAGQQAQGQRSQGNWQGQGRPGGQANAGPGRYQGQGQRDQGQRGPDRQQAQGRNSGQYDRDRRSEGGPLARVIREAARNGSYDNNRSGWNNNDRGDQARRPVIRPEDRRDRDRNRQRYDQRRFPHYVTPRQRYQWRGSPWRPPVGFYSFRWQWGQTLPWTWYTPDYYLNDYWAYGLPMPPIGCEWVRVGDDAILVDVFTGRVYQVVYDLFW